MKINKNSQKTAWLEHVIISNFRIWHIIAFCSGILLAIFSHQLILISTILVIVICCCIRLRIPRTKQEIEADYRRKYIIKKFREKLLQIKNSEIDDMDLQKVLHYMQNSYLNSNPGT